jgi:hypothetical protein
MNHEELYLKQRNGVGIQVVEVLLVDSFDCLLLCHRNGFLRSIGGSGTVDGERRAEEERRGRVRRESGRREGGNTIYGALSRCVSASLLFSQAYSLF